MQSGTLRVFLELWLLACLLAGCEAPQPARGSAGTAAPPPAADWAAGRKFGVVVGVNRYDDAGIGNLRFAVADAAAIHAALTQAENGFNPEQLALLTDDMPQDRQPTRNNILKYLNNFIGLAGAQDTVLVYFAGHGTTEDSRLYLMPSDGSASLAAKTGVAFEDVRGMLEISPAKRKVLLLDACHSAQGRSVRRMDRSVADQLQFDSEGMVVLASCGPDEVSHEMEETGHGAFTHFLLEGLSGAADTNGDTLIGAKELSVFAWDRTRLWASNKGLTQNPWDLSRVSGDIVLTSVITVDGESSDRQPEAGDEMTVELGGGVTLEMVWIPPGTFVMGSPANEAGREDDETQHTVTITRGFWMGKYEITQAQCERLTDTKSSYFTGDPDLPLENISWEGCMVLLESLNRRTRGGGFRLPTEAEWEYACRAGSTTPFHFGQTISTDQANYNGNFTYGKSRKGMFRDKTTPVGSFPPNAWGLHDMHGNVGEWCWDWYEDDFYDRGPDHDPKNSSGGEYRVIRGGNWMDDPAECRSAKRRYADPTDWDSYVGVRVVLDD